MDFCEFNNFDDFMRFCGYTRCNKEANSDDDENYSSKNNTTCGFDTGCYDIPGGFQGVNPQCFAIIGEIIGDVLAGNLPYNVQNSIGNWFELIGQVILTYNAQQQYFEGGPGRCFNPSYYNSNNSFCQTKSDDTGENNNSNTTSNKSNDKENKFNKSYIKKNNEEINELKSHINELMKQIEEIKNEINNIKTNK